MNKKHTLKLTDCESFEILVAMRHWIQLCESTCKDAFDFESLLNAISARNKIVEEGHPNIPHPHGPLSWDC